MDYVETKALKTSFWPETSFKQNPQVLSEDLWGGNGVNDDLFVEGLLDFSNEEDVVEEKQFFDNKEDGLGLGLGFGLGKGLGKGFEDNPNSNSNFNSSDVKDESGSGSGSGSVPGSELSVPADDVADLEWLSHFVEDSFSEFTLQHQSSEEKEKLQTERVNGAPRPVSVIPAASFPAKARRSKRSRTGGRVWSFGSLSLPELSSCSSSSTSSSTSTSTTTSSSSCLIFNNPDMGHWFRYMDYKPVKKVKKRVMTEAQLQRRCSHCGVQKTPQWRAGPLGAKTLCNACGVRFKSGRLLPEYRPACSPTFSSEVHSNNHRKVLEMRRKKEDRNFQVV